MKVLIRLDWRDYIVECASTELDGFMPFLSKMRKMDTKGTDDNGPYVLFIPGTTLDLDTEIKVLPASTRIFPAKTGE